MKSGIEYLTSNINIAFPFREDATGLVRDQEVVSHGASATIPINCFVDACLTFPRTLDEFLDVNTTIFLYSIERVSSTIYKFTFKNIIGTILIAECDISGISSDSQFDVLYFQSVGKSVKLIINTANALDWLSTITSTDIYGTRLPFESRTVLWYCHFVSSFMLYDTIPPITPTTGPITGDVKLINGYNTDLTYENNRITLTAEADAGKGRAPCSEVDKTKVIRGLMNLVSDDYSSINITGDSCFNIIPINSTGSILINGVCKACCTCEDYVNVHLALKRQLNRLKEVKTKLEDGHFNYYTVGVTKFNKDIAPKYADIIMAATAQIGRKWEKAVVGPGLRRGSSQLITFIVKVVNKGSFPATLLNLSGIPFVRQNYAIKQIADTATTFEPGQNPVIVLNDALSRGKTITYTFFCDVTYPNTGHGIYTLTLNANIKINDIEVPKTLNYTVKVL